MQERIRKIIEFGFEHSTARAFLIFSGIFVIFSIGYAKEYTSIAFFTFFYAFIVYRIVILRKTEIWGDYAVGDNFGALLYFLIEWLFFIGWIAGLVLLLTDVNLVNLFGDYRHIFLSKFFVVVLTLASTTFVAWIVLIYWRKIGHEKIKCGQRNEAKCYEVECCCKNCDLNKKVKIPKKMRVENFPCPECEVSGVLRKKGDCKNPEGSYQNH